MRKHIKVILQQSPNDEYRIEELTNAITVGIGSKEFHAGDTLTEKEAKRLCEISVYDVKIKAWQPGK